MRRTFPEAMVSDYETLIPTMANHPKDRHVLAVAVQAGCRMIVTADVAGSRASALTPHRVTAIHPDQFLLGLAENDPDAAWAAVERKRRLYRRPALNSDTLCNRLGKGMSRSSWNLDGVGSCRAVRIGLW